MDSDIVTTITYAIITDALWATSAWI